MTTSTDPWVTPQRRRAKQPAAFAASEAARDARILHRVAGVLLAVVSVLCACAVVAGVAWYVKGGEHVAALVLIGSSVVAWLTVALQCLMGQAVARYIEFRADR